MWPLLVALCSVQWDCVHAAPPGSNAIKHLAGGFHSPDSDVFNFDNGNQNIVIDNFQTHSCAADEDCGRYEHCNESRGTCALCRKRRKRCQRDAMCCPGNSCVNGVCLPSDVTRQESTAVVSMNHTAGRNKPHKSQEGENCLRSTDCADGLCCARHFWSRICKPVLTEGQVCTRLKKKGAHGLEIFQRCDCGDGLACRVQAGDNVSKFSRNLHTCQRR